MKRWQKYCAGLAAFAGLTPGLWAQAVPATPAVPGAPAAPAPAPMTLWTFLGLGKDQKAACKEKLCRSQLGQLLNNGLKPVSMFSGGIIPGCCPPALPSDLLKPPGSAEGAAARIKKDEAEAKERIAAVRYLGTVDCHYWPEAQDALINALRADRNECVRYEAALALMRGCCCTKPVIEALAITISGSERDGNPAERSERVRDAAQSALQGCLARLGAVTALPAEAPVEKEKEKEPEKVSPPSDTGSTPQSSAGYYKRVSAMPADKVVQNARQTLARLNTAPVQTAAAPARASRGEGGVVGILRSAFRPAAVEPVVVPAAAPLVVQESPRLLPQAPAAFPAGTVPATDVPPRGPEMPRRLP